MTQVVAAHAPSPGAPLEKTPRELVEALDHYIVGQTAAKRAVAVALRNRWRRKQIDAPLRDDISPKNIILIGATGVGKTEIARRLAKLTQAPFLKVEASKFTEVGYMGRDVESIVRDLTEAAVHLVRTEALERVQRAAEQQAQERLLDLLLPKAPSDANGEPHDNEASRRAMAALLQAGKLENSEVEIDIEERRNPIPIGMFGGPNAEPQASQQLGEWMASMTRDVLGRNRKKRRATVRDAREALAKEEAQRLLDEDAIHKEALERTQQEGIVFLDEVDKIACRERGAGGNGPDVSREGVQRDILPIVEGSTVQTKYGPVDTQHILFIAAGAFHVAKVSDLIPELQGRFPIRVELDALSEADLLRILHEPKHALPLQYTALMKTEGIVLTFAEDGLEALARSAATANERAENIGARRLSTVLEKVLEDVSFRAQGEGDARVVVDRHFVEKSIGRLLEAEDVARYIL